MKYSWATDIHLDHLQTNQQLIDFAELLVKDNPTGIFLSGDISNAKSLVFHLSAIEKIVQRPTYFVLGNHDYYGSAIDVVRKTMREVSNVSPFLRYMPTMPYYALTPNTALVGHDGWYDANYGDWKTSRFSLTDWTAIYDFRQTNSIPSQVVTVARKLALEGVQHIHNGIKQAIRYHKNIVVLTHVPPFKESHIYQGKQGDDEAQPWFTNKLLGDMLLDASKAFPNVTFNVLCGHTHGKFSAKIRDNLLVNVGEAEYRTPQVQGHIEIL